MENCCQPKCRPKNNVWSGIFYGIIPHTFCILFFILSIIGATSGAAIAKNFLLLPNFFLLLTGLSLISATLSAIFYLKKNKCCTVAGLKNKAKYISALYTITIITNIFFIYIVMPAFANNQDEIITNNLAALSLATIEVQLPCPGHAPLITEEIKTIPGVKTVNFKMPRTFEITYNPEETNLEEIKTLEIFKNFKIKNN